LPGSVSFFLGTFTKPHYKTVLKSSGVFFALCLFVLAFTAPFFPAGKSLLFLPPFVVLFFPSGTTVEICVKSSTDIYF